jgi:hypothetical protein
MFVARVLSRLQPASKKADAERKSGKPAETCLGGATLGISVEMKQMQDPRMDRNTEHKPQRVCITAAPQTEIADTNIQTAS